MKKLLFLIFLPFFLFCRNVDVYFFWGKGCFHCEKEKIFLSKLEDKYRNIHVHRLEVWHNPENEKLLREVRKVLRVEATGLPFTLVGSRYFVGWNDERTTGIALEKTILEAMRGRYTDVVKMVKKSEVGIVQNGDLFIPESIKIPIWGKIKIADFSLPVLTVVLGVVDGFNPCAMWALVLLLSFLLQMRDKQRMWIFGSTFLLVSAVVYFMFMVAWLNLILFLGLIKWIRIGIGILALGAGIYNFKEFFQSKGACKITGIKTKEMISKRLQILLEKRKFWIALGGVAIVAFCVNLIELFCSAGIPAVYTQVLALSNLATVNYYLYILLYIFFFTLNNLTVFVIAMISFHLTDFTTKYVGVSKFIGAVVLTLLGLALIFKPELLMFGG